MDTAHFFWGQLNPVFINVRIDPFVPPFDPVDLLNLVAEVQRHYKLTDDYIQTRAKTTACYDYSLNFIRVEKDVFTWTCSQELNAPSNIIISAVLRLNGHKAVVRNEGIRW